MKIYILCDNDKMVKAYLKRITAETKAEEKQLENDEKVSHNGKHYWHVHDIDLVED